MTTEADKPALDLSYSIEDFEAGTHRDSQYLYRIIEDTMLELSSDVRGGRVLDVACGTGKQAMRIAERGCYTIGTEASDQMIGLGRWLQPESRAGMVRSIAEELPFADASFDRIMCQGSLDHFSDPMAFMREAARITKPNGRIIIALANFESVSCRLGRGVDALQRRLRRPRPSWRLYWQVPEDHNVKGDLAYVRSLHAGALSLERCFGLSFLWNVAPVTWLVDHLPERMASPLWHGMSRLVRTRPQHSDMIISVWRKKNPGA